MAVAIVMPKQGNTVESCILSKWYVKVGDKVKIGDLLFNYETDKSTFDEECKNEGEVLALLYEEGEDIPCLLNVMVIGEHGEDISSLVAASDANTEEVKQEEVKVEIKEEVVATTAPESAGDKIFISPRARMLADKAKIDVSFATPTGPQGRIIERDIERLIAQGAPTTAGAIGKANSSMAGTGIGSRISTGDLTSKVAAVENTPVVPEYVDEKLTTIRKTIAKTMHASMSDMAQLTLNTSFDATSILNFRKHLKAVQEENNLPNVTLNDIILFAVARVLTKHTNINAHFIDGTTLRRFNGVNLGIAVDTERGLMVPTLFGANKVSLFDISAQTKALAKSAQAGTISPDLLSGSTFTVTNLGSLGIESFTPIINPPQVAILGVDNITWKIKNGGDKPEYYQAMGLSLTIDHRVVDGAPAARFLQDLCKYLENFDVYALLNA
ncbi:MAG: 2-oxo acid dehydrogenase subunit E2 [Clostridiales bacterium]|nr:2-oxo acid dehydrogenase subunit E2 [Clostridiales bacterium]